ncbi:LPS export ABC transporter protein LptC [Chitinophaga skermanii]|uniref:LPS export ABC transporter protein LptC n=2 Tax=Chitinophaga skermanii TaxID=331697 RepID=A0A327QAS2_9BACT|nr:LPS export ABC transporter protein LptC [Chitinophaga skermanii]
MMLMAATAGLFSCENDMNDVNAVQGNNKGIEKGDSITAMYSQKGIVKAELRSPYMERHIEDVKPYVIFPKGLHVDFFDDSTKVSGELQADWGKYFDNDADIFLKKNVVFINLKEQRRLDCQELTWDSKKGMFFCNSNVRISTPNDTLYGTGMESDQNFANYKIFNPSGTLPGGFIDTAATAPVDTTAGNPVPVAPATPANPKPTVQ